MKDEYDFATMMSGKNPYVSKPEALFIVHRSTYPNTSLKGAQV